MLSNRSRTMLKVCYEGKLGGEEREEREGAARRPDPFDGWRGYVTLVDLIPLYEKSNKPAFQKGG